MKRYAKRKPPSLATKRVHRKSPTGHEHQAAKSRTNLATSLFAGPKLLANASLARREYFATCRTSVACRLAGMHGPYYCIPVLKNTIPTVPEIIWTKPDKRICFTIETLLDTREQICSWLVLSPSPS